MLKRIITAIVLVIIVAPCLIFGGYFLVGLGTLVATLASYEMTRVYRKDAIGLHFLGSLIFPVVFILSFLYLYAYYTKLETLLKFALVLWLSVLLITLLVSTFAKESPRLVEGISFAYLFPFLLTITFGLGFRSSFVFKGFTIASPILIYLISITVLTDTFAYFVGMLFGKHRLAPTISPKKSVEGAIGGLAFGSIIPVLVAWGLGLFKLYDFPLYLSFVVFFLISLVLSVSSQIGDLVLSKIKRRLNVKDFSNLMPGHGGILDRFDSLSLTGPVFIIVLAIVGAFI